MSDSGKLILSREVIESFPREIKIIALALERLGHLTIKDEEEEAHADH